MAERAVLYARVSGDDRGKEGRNLDGQLKLGREYAASKGYLIVAELAEDDRGVSGASFDLEKLNQALDMARNRQFDVLVVRELDRLARSLAKQLIVETELKRYGVAIEYVLADYDDTPEGQLQKHVRAVIADYEKGKIAERTTRGRFNFVRRGNVLGHGKAPFGYRLAENNGKRVLTVYEQEAQTVRLIFGLYVDDKLSIRGITKKLTALGLPTANDMRGGYKMNNLGVWSPGAIQHILSNETYAGVWHYGKTRSVHGRFSRNGRDHWVPVNVTPIVERTVWDAAQARRLANKRLAASRQRYDYLLSGRLTCGSCKLAVSGRTTRYGDKLYHYYFCPGKTDHSPRACSLPSFSGARVDATVWNWLKEWLSDPLQVARGLMGYQTNQAVANQPVVDRLDTIGALLTSNRAQLERVLDMYLAGSFPEEMLTERKNRLQTTIRSLEAEEAALKASLSAVQLTDGQIATIKDFSEDIRRGLGQLDESFAAKRQLIEALDVRAILAIEAGQPTIHVSCTLTGKVTLSIASTSN